MNLSSHPPISPLSPSPPLPPPQVVAVVEQNPLQRTLKRFVSFIHRFFSLAVYSIWVCVRMYIWGRVRVCVATFARRDGEGEKGNLYLDPASHARRVFCTLCDPRRVRCSFATRRKTILRPVLSLTSARLPPWRPIQMLCIKKTCKYIVRNTCKIMPFI